MVQTAKSFGVRSTALSKYISLQVRLAVLGGVDVQQHAGACYVWQLRKLSAIAEVAACLPCPASCCPCILAHSKLDSVLAQACLHALSLMFRTRACPAAGPTWPVLCVQSLAFTGGLVQRFPWIRDRMIADDKFLFKVVAEVLIDSGGEGLEGQQETLAAALLLGSAGVLLLVTN
jgi:hypothetical protein